MRISIIPIETRMCDLCGVIVTDEDHTALRSFVLSRWGVICIGCWDDRIIKHADFDIIEIYAKSQRIEEPWIRRPMAFCSPNGSDEAEDAVRSENPIP